MQRDRIEMNIHQANMRITELRLVRAADGKTSDIDQIDVDVLESGEELFAGVYWSDNSYNMVLFDFPPGITAANFDKAVVSDMLTTYPNTAVH